MTPLRPHPEGTIIAVKAVPGARRDSIEGLTGDRLKIRVAAPANENRANVRLTEFLAETLTVHRRNVEVLRGDKARMKDVLVRGLTPAEVEQRLPNAG